MGSASTYTLEPLSPSSSDESSRVLVEAFRSSPYDWTRPAGLSEEGVLESTRTELMPRFVRQTLATEWPLCFVARDKSTRQVIGVNLIEEQHFETREQVRGRPDETDPIEALLCAAFDVFYSNVPSALGGKSRVAYCAYVGVKPSVRRSRVAFDLTVASFANLRRHGFEHAFAVAVSADSASILSMFGFRRLGGVAYADFTCCGLEGKKPFASIPGSLYVMHARVADINLNGAEGASRI